MLAEEFGEQFTCMGENTEEHIPFSVSIERKLQELVKMEKILQKSYLTECNLLIAQNLWQAHYQILLIILLKKFIKSNVNMNMIIKNTKRVQ